MEETAFLHQLTLGDAADRLLRCDAHRVRAGVGRSGEPARSSARRGAPRFAGTRRDDRRRRDLHSAADATKWHTQRVNNFRSPNARSRSSSATRSSIFGPLHGASRSTLVGWCRTSIFTSWRRVSMEASSGRRSLAVSAAWSSKPPASATSRRPWCRPSGRRFPRGLRWCRSRCPEGGVAPVYGYPGGGQKLLELGVIFGGELPGQKAASS